MSVAFESHDDIIPAKPEGFEPSISWSEAKRPIRARLWAPVVEIVKGNIIPTEISFE